ncbi:MAG: stage III sporulation protein AF [Lachnospiraceae bacterium]|nr:stage III sporulation protein AF [Lachnospiraceae bacterium]
MVNLCKEIVAFLLVAKILESFQTENKYGKIIKLLIALVVVLKLITPLFTLFDSDFDFNKAVTQMEKRFVRMDGDIVTGEEIVPIEKIEIDGIEIKVGEIGWEN